MSASLTADTINQGLSYGALAAVIAGVPPEVALGSLAGAVIFVTSAVVSCESYIQKIAESNIYYLNSSQDGKRKFIGRLKSDGESLATKFAMDEKLKNK